MKHLTFIRARLNCSLLIAGGLALAALESHAQPIYAPYIFNTLAGLTGHSGSSDGTLVNGSFSRPGGVAVDASGTVYVADTFNSTIRLVSPAGVISTFAGLAGAAGSADGTGNAARFNYPGSLAVDTSGNIYVADTFNFAIRKINTSGVVTTVAGAAGSTGTADGTGVSARFNFPGGIALDGARNMFVADTYNCTIRKITQAGVVTTLAGSPGQPGSADGTGSAAQFNYPTGLALDSSGNIYVADLYNHTIRKVTSAGVVTTLAGLAGSAGNADGTGMFARFDDPCSVSVDASGNIYVADKYDSIIRKVTPGGVVTTPATGFFEPNGVAVDTSGNLYVADTGYDLVRKVTGATVTTLAGVLGVPGGQDGGIGAHFNSPYGVAVDGSGNLFVADTYNCTLRKVSSSGIVTTIAGLAGTPGSANGTGSAALFNYPYGVALDSSGNLYVADSSNDTIRKVTPAGVVTTLAGLAGSSGSANGTGANARFNSPNGVGVDSLGNVYVADYFNEVIRKVSPVGVVTVFAGQVGFSGNADGLGVLAQFFHPTGVAVDKANNVYVTDYGNSSIRKITSAGLVSTLAGGTIGDADGLGIVARFNQPFGLAVDGSGNVFVADTINCTVRKVTPLGLSTTLAGLPNTAGSVDGAGNAVRFNYPYGIAVDSAGNVYVADAANHTIREGHLANGPPMIITSGTGFGFNGSHFGFCLSGPVGQSVVVEVSTNLAKSIWLPVWTNTFNGVITFTDPNSAANSKRYYRARLP